MLNRIRFGAIAAAFATILSATTAKAEIYTEYTKGTTLPTGQGMITPNASNLGLAINLAGLATAVIPNTDALPGSYLIVDKNLDATGSGTMYINGGLITLVDFTYTIPVGVLGTLTATGSGIGFTFSGGPIAVTNNSFSISSSTPGSLSINAGSIALSGTLLGQSIDASLDFNTDPVTQDFSGLGSSTIPGRADADQTGSDTDTQSHNGYNVLGGVPDPGLTGFSNIDTDGAETFINYNGFSIATTIVSGSLTLPTTITITGSTTVSVPEVSSIALIGASVVGLGVIARRRRSA